MRRRQVLTAAALLGSVPLAGCNSGEVTTLRLREVEQPSLAIREGDLGDEFRDDQVALVRNATADGSATAHGYDPFEDTEYVRVDGTYYRIRTGRGSEEQVDGTVLVVAPASDTADAVPRTSTAATSSNWSRR